MNRKFLCFLLSLSFLHCYLVWAGLRDVLHSERIEPEFYTTSWVPIQSIPILVGLHDSTCVIFPPLETPFMADILADPSCLSIDITSKSNRSSSSIVLW